MSNFLSLADSWIAPEAYETLRMSFLEGGGRQTDEADYPEASQVRFVQILEALSPSCYRVSDGKTHILCRVLAETAEASSAHASVGVDKGILSRKHAQAMRANRTGHEVSDSNLEYTYCPVGSVVKLEWYRFVCIRLQNESNSISNNNNNGCNFFHPVQLTIGLETVSLEFLGGEGMGIIGNPIPVEKTILIKQALQYVNNLPLETRATEMTRLETATCTYNKTPSNASNHIRTSTAVQQFHRNRGDPMALMLRSHPNFSGLVQEKQDSNQTPPMGSPGNDPSKHEIVTNKSNHFFKNNLKDEHDSNMEKNDDNEAKTQNSLARVQIGYKSSNRIENNPHRVTNTNPIRRLGNPVALLQNPAKMEQFLKIAVLGKEQNYSSSPNVPDASMDGMSMIEKQQPYDDRIHKRKETPGQDVGVDIDINNKNVTSTTSGEYVTDLKDNSNFPDNLSHTKRRKVSGSRSSLLLSTSDKSGILSRTYTIDTKRNVSQNHSSMFASDLSYPSTSSSESLAPSSDGDCSTFSDPIGITEMLSSQATATSGILMPINPSLEYEEAITSKTATSGASMQEEPISIENTNVFSASSPTATVVAVVGGGSEMPAKRSLAKKALANVGADGVDALSALERNVLTVTHANKTNTHEHSSTLKLLSTHYRAPHIDDASFMQKWRITRTFYMCLWRQ